MYNYKRSISLGYADAVAKVKDVYVKGEKTFVSAILPTVQLGKVGNQKLLPIAEQVENKLKKVVDATAGN